MYDWSGETPGLWVINAAGEPISGPWASPSDAKVHAKRKPGADGFVAWDGSCFTDVQPQPSSAPGPLTVQAAQMALAA